jgi:hypothetical protein
MILLRCSFVCFFLPNPYIPSDPAENRACASPSNYSGRIDPFLKNACEAAYKDGYAADLLYNDGRIRNEAPEFVGLKFGISLKVIEKRRCIGIIIGVCSCQWKPFRKCGMGFLQLWRTHNNFRNTGGEARFRPFRLITFLAGEGSNAGPSDLLTPCSNPKGLNGRWLSMSFLLRRDLELASRSGDVTEERGICSGI